MKVDLDAFAATAVEKARQLEAKGLGRPTPTEIFVETVIRFHQEPNDIPLLIACLASVYALGYLNGEENNNASKSYLHCNEN